MVFHTKGMTMLIRLPDAPTLILRYTSRIEDLEVKELCSSGGIFYSFGVNAGGGSLTSKRLAMGFPTRESAEAWADEVAKLVNAAGNPCADPPEQDRVYSAPRSPVTASATFRCPKCGGKLFSGPSVLGVYRCQSKPLEVCNWRGPREQCFVNPTAGVDLAAPGTKSYSVQFTPEPPQLAADHYSKATYTAAGGGGASSIESACGSNGGNGGDVEMACGGAGGGRADYAIDTSTSPANLLITKLDTGDIEFRIQFADGRGGDFIIVSPDVAAKKAASILAMTLHLTRHREDSDVARLQAVYDQGVRETIPTLNKALQLPETSGINEILYQIEQLKKNHGQKCREYPSFADWEPTPEQPVLAVMFYNEITNTCKNRSDWEQKPISLRWLTAWRRVFAQQGEKP